jgi:exodeoxyribonuclease V beta subunit
MTTAPAFDLTGPLPSGVTMLEASAGTGKTFTIAGLTARYVAEGVPLERMLLVTFTRMATGELRERVRQRLVDTQRGLARVLAEGSRPDTDDEVLDLLATGTAAEVDRRRARLAVAIADFDAATITTTHGFCHRMLAGLGVAGDIESATAVVEDVRDLLAEVVDDRYLARALQTAKPPFDAGKALTIAEAAVANPRTPIAPVLGAPDSAGRLRRRLALSVREDIARRQRELGLVTYDDLLTRLADALDDPVSGPAARARLRDRYDVVLVDEFQDTDDLQWRILSSAFGAGATLVLIGDPKQAIYAFRGADVHAYLDAADGANRSGTLAVNWRSDQGLLDAYDTLWDGASLGHPAIAYRRVAAAPPHRMSGLDAPADPAPLRVRVLHRDDGAVELTRTGFARKPSAKQVIARDLAAETVRLLTSGATLLTRDSEGRTIGRRPVEPGDIAVLTRSHRNATAWSAALAAAGVPAVLSGVGSVFATPAAGEWLLLLEALERPASSPRIHNMALTGFIGWDAARIDSADEDAWEGLHAACHHWAAVLRRSGVATLLELITRTRDLPERELSRPDGERRLTDLRHVGQLLHAEATTERLGTTALTAWLRRRIRDAADDANAEERSRRLESDADAVQVLTIHRSKGLEFPVVLYPDLWEPTWIPDKDEPVVYHDDDGVRTIDVSGAGTEFEEHRRRQKAELRGEDLRLAYVALTRARHQSVVWWAGCQASADSPLGRLLFARRPDGTIPPNGARTPSDDAVAERFAGLAVAAPGCISVERAVPAATSRWSPGTAATSALSVAMFDRPIDTDWRRTSYSGLTADAHEAVVASEPELLAVVDEADPDVELSVATATADAGETALRDVRLRLASVPGGARLGSLVHAMLETVDFTAGDLDAALTVALTDALQRWPISVASPGDLVAGLRDALATPLGPLAGERRLCDIARSDRLDELGFELPVAGGNRPTGNVDLAAVADLVETHLPAGDPLSDYPARLRDPSVAGAFHGFLTGSLDLVARFRDGSGEHRYLVMDYKTNVLGEDRGLLRAWDYRPEALAVAMQRAHYPLQALLYLVALHRYLRWRVADYDPDVHLGGALYLFVRGMTGADGPRPAGGPCGVFAWRPPTSLVLALSDLLAEGDRRGR